MNPTEHSLYDRMQLKFIVAAVLMLLGLLASTIILGLRVERGDVSSPTETAKAFPVVELEAKAAYVYDVVTGETLFSKEADKRLPLASLTKVMAALVATETLPPTGVVVVGSEALATYGDSGFSTNERWSLRDILDFSLITSSNDGMSAVAYALGSIAQAGTEPEEVREEFIRIMNDKASELGLHNTYFWNETGLDESEQQGGAYGTASDMAMLLEYILANYPDLLNATKEATTTISSLDNIAHVAGNTNKVVYEIPGLLASKTGYTNTAGGNLVFAFDPEIGHPIVVSILGSSADGRFEDAKRLVDATLTYLTQ